MLFAALVVERPPPQWSQFPALLGEWVQVVGSLAALGLLLWSIAWFLSKENRRRVSGGSPLGRAIFVGSTAVSFVGFGLLLLLYLGVSLLGSRRLEGWLPGASQGTNTPGDWLFTGAGAFALLAVAYPVLHDMIFRMRWGRIFALARLSLKEAVRSRIVLVFSAMALIFLFADWFVPYKPENQIRNYVRVVYWSMTPLFLLTAAILGAFSIPADVKNQSIHTIVTKPVEKFEIVLGRFLGYGFLLTVGMIVISCLSLVYVLRGIHPDAERESFKARVPVFGSLGFEGTKEGKGENVGRVWDYRQYIGGRKPTEPEEATKYAFWAFDDFPTDLAQRTEDITFEFTFDIFRLTKGEENKGVLTTFWFADGRLSTFEIRNRLKKQREERLRLQVEARRNLAGQKEFEEKLVEIEKDLLRKFGVHEQRSLEVVDYHTLQVRVPPDLFAYLAEQDEENPRTPTDGQALPPALRVLVSVDSTPTNYSQMLGVARYDLYILAAEKPFWQNFLKGAAGMWFTSILVLGIAVALSTYLSGVISFLCSLFLFGAGLFTDYISKLAAGQMDGGGPLESLYRIAGRIQHSGHIDDNPVTSLFRTGDMIYGWWIRRFLNLIPDVTRFDLHQYVANGFDIPVTQVLLLDNLVPLLAYLIPMGVLAFYLMKFREIANPT